MLRSVVIGGRFQLGLGGDLPSHEQDALVREGVAIANVLRRCLGDTHDMRVLRVTVAGAQRSEHVLTLSDLAVVDLAIQLATRGRVYLLRLVSDPEFPTLSRRDRMAPAAAPSAPAPRPSSAPPTPPPPRAPAPVDVVPSFGANLDAAALAATLRAASQDGTPFCEECARAARAA